MATGTSLNLIAYKLNSTEAYIYNQFGFYQHFKYCVVCVGSCYLRRMVCEIAELNCTAETFERWLDTCLRHLDQSLRQLTAK